MAMASTTSNDTVVKWIKSLKEFPPLPYEALLEHLNKSGRKEFGSKCYKFYAESFIHDVFVSVSGMNNFKAKARCYRSQRKNESPHNIFIDFKKQENNLCVVGATCSCKAGAGGICNHVFGMLFLLNHWSMLKIQEIPCGSKETCTSVPQVWHKPRGDKIRPDPVMKCVFTKSGYEHDKKRKMEAVSCKLYDARRKNLRKSFTSTSVMNICNVLSQQDRPPPFSYLLSDQEYCSTVKSVFGEVPVGSALGYQLNDEGNSSISFTCSLSNHSVNAVTSNSTMLEDQCHFPNLPILRIKNNNDYVSSQSEEEKLFVKEFLSVDINKAWNLQTTTISQTQSKEWHLERRYRLTPSNFGRILIRKKQPTDKFLSALFQSKIISVPSVLHGQKNEYKARELYAKQLTKTGLYSACI